MSNEVVTGRFQRKGFRISTDEEASNRIREIFDVLEAAINKEVPYNRYRSVAFTDLEKASCMLTRAFTHGQDS